MGRWTEAEVGSELGPREFHLSEEAHDGYLESLHDHHVHDGVVDPSVAGNLVFELLDDHYPGPVVHSHQEFRFHKPVQIGETVVGSGTVTRKETRRGRAYIAVECEFRRKDTGEVVWWARTTCVWPEVYQYGED